MAADSHDNHGHTPAAWTAVALVMIGFTVAGVAIVLDQPPYFWLGMAVVVAGGLVGKIMQRMGYGQTVGYAQREAERRREDALS